MMSRNPVRTEQGFSDSERKKNRFWNMRGRYHIGTAQGSNPAMYIYPALICTHVICLVSYAQSVVGMITFP